MPTIPEGKWRTYALILIGAVVVLQLLRPSRQPDTSAYDAIVQAHTRNVKRLERAEDSLKAVASTARIVYVTTSTKARALVAALPPAKIVGDTLTLPDGTFVVPHPVAQFVAQQDSAIVSLQRALVAADTALVATVAVIPVADSATSETKIIAAAEHDKAEASRPGFFARAWEAVKLPVIAVGSGVLGYTIHAVLH